VPMALRVAADDGAIEDVEVGKQHGGTVTFVVVRHRPRAPWLHRQPRPGTVERLNLAFLVDRENDRMGGRIDVEASLSFSANFGSVDSLNMRMRWGARAMRESG
jgi:hypothetical protein